RISELDNLRVLAVKKDFPYAREGETVNFRMLLEDGESPGRAVEIFWGFWCVNPPGDSFTACLATPPVAPPVFEFDKEEFAIDIPEDIIRENPQDPTAPPYGLVYVFHAACAGRLDFSEGSDGFGGFGGSDGLDFEGDGSVGEFPDDVSPLTALPVCLDEQGEPLGPDDFIVGFSAVYVFEEYRNANPVINGFGVDNASVTPECIGNDCEGEFDPDSITGCTEGVVCLKACEDDGDPSCPEIKLEVQVDRSSVEEDELARDSYGSSLEESIWVSYFADRGSVASDVKLVNDAVEGWVDDQSTDFYAPEEVGPLRLWAVVRDNRGGQEWIRIPAYVE
ncbi:MAG: hypothetical protein MK135_08330, partial [Polyangiaceae bacterium]|nr:hypothetical protein [Polyangiaceae bacterium]